MYLTGLVGAAALYLSTPAEAVTKGNPRRQPFHFDITSFTTTLSLPVTDAPETVKMTDQQMQTRLEKAPEDETIEPLTLLMTEDDKQITEMAEKLAAAGKSDELAAYMKKELKESKPVKPGAATKTLEIDKEGFELLDKEAFADLYSKTHHNLTINGAELKKDKVLRKEFMKQIVPFFKKDERKAIQEKINKGDMLSVDELVLPEFARKMVRKYIVYRGPNCFHAALAFQSPQLTASSLINVKKETGYHRAMINYDELWRVLGREFYEVDPDKQPLKYGDMLVFFDVPEEDADDLEKPVDFKWIRHTATYLFGGYTFSKGSKSPNTPYTVRTLAEEWKTWKHYTQNLGVKVFRRSQKAVKLHPPTDLQDWMY